MAGDWIKMREDLHEDPAVLWMAQELKTRPEHVVGYLHRFWGWVSRNCVPENAGQMSRKEGDRCPDSVPVTAPKDYIEMVIGLPGFIDLLCHENVSWARFDAENQRLVIPKIDRHLSEGAKTRALAAEKKRTQRKGQMSPEKRDKCPAKKGTREEKRRDINTPLNPPAEAGELSSDESEESQEVANVVAYWLERQPQAQAGDKGRRRIAEALAAGYQEHQLCLAIKGYLAANPKKPSLRAALRDEDAIAGWIAAGLNNGKRETATAPDVQRELDRGHWRKRAKAAGKSDEWIDEQCKIKFGD